MSSTPINVDLDEGRSRALLIRSTSAPKLFSYSVLQSAISSSNACCFVRAWVTHSRPARTLGLRTAFVNSCTGTPSRWHAFSTCAGALNPACSPCLSALISTLPMCNIAATIRKRSNCSAGLKPTTARAFYTSTMISIFREKRTGCLPSELSTLLGH